MNGQLGTLYGQRVFINDDLREFVFSRFPRSKKKRIVKKWKKDKNNYRHVPSKDIYKTSYGLIMTTEVWKAITKQVIK